MRRPEDLRQTVEIDQRARGAAGMIGSKAAVLTGMPILRCYDNVEERLQLIDQRDDLISPVNRQGAAGHEVILDINEDKSMHGKRG